MIDDPIGSPTARDLSRVVLSLGQPTHFEPGRHYGGASFRCRETLGSKSY